MFKSMKRIIQWAGKYKGRLYLGSVFSFFSSLSTAIPLSLIHISEVTIPTPDQMATQERISTPRGSFCVTAMSREQMEAAGYGFCLLDTSRCV